jgi:transcription termination/antitermination protein NusG
MTDDEHASVADDAVSNRSDDTALEEAEGANANGQQAAAPDESSSEAATQDQALAAQNEVAAGDGDDSAEAVDSVGAEEPDAEDTDADETDADDEEVAAAPATPRGPVELTPEEPEDIKMDWYILKVQSNRERTIAEALERKMRIEGYDRYFDQVVVPTEKVTEFKGGKKKVVERKLYPGYIVVHMHINDDTWFAVRETSGVGDFTGAGGKPTPMLASEVARIIQSEEEETSESPKLDIKFAAGDKIKVKEGNFESFEGEVAKIDEASGRVTVLIHIFGRSTQVELEYWQIEAV